MPSQKVSFPGSLGEPLAARLDLPDNSPRGFAVFAHCFTCSKDSKAAAYIARALAEAGFGVLRFDFTGLGGSGGDFGNTSFTSNADDLLAAVAYLRAEHQAPSLMIGHSLGGAATLAAAGRVPECRAVVTIGAPFDPEHVSRQFEGELELIREQGRASVSIAGRQFNLSKGFVDDLSGQPQHDRIHNLKKALLVMHAATDRIVGVDNARRIFQSALHPKSFVSLDDADHLMTKETDARYAASVLTAWAARYIQANDAESGLPPQADISTTDASARTPEGFVRVSERGTGLFANTVSTSQHSLIADEPTSVGGTDLGMTPYQLLQAALGACTTMTIRMYAQRKKWPLDNVSVDLHHDKIHATDCEHCETTSGKVDQISRQISLQGNLDAEQRAKLLEIADKCPVHRSLHSEISITTELVTDSGEVSS
ncbi:MAG: bifunctional alpha/beta hydrolase/OsmC family protein [Burkholderiaceae bacterium]